MRLLRGLPGRARVAGTILAAVVLMAGIAYSDDDEKPIAPFSMDSTTTYSMGEETMQVEGLSAPESDVNEMLEPQTTSLLIVEEEPEDTEETISLSSGTTFDT